MVLVNGTTEQAQVIFWQTIASQTSVQRQWYADYAQTTQPFVMQSPVTRVTALVSQAASGQRGAGNCLQMTHKARHGNRYDTLRQSRPCLKYTCQQCDPVALKTMKHSTHTAFIGKSKIKMDKISNTSNLMLPIFQTADGERITRVRTTSVDARSRAHKTYRIYCWHQLH